ncbi:MAG: hypothetical protein ACRDM1_11530, partial [Gaiellaceae bacterium]
SPLLRARQTAEAIALGANATDCDDQLLAPGAGVEELKRAVAGRGEVVVAVAHQPDCGEIALALTGREHAFPPGGFVEVQLGDEGSTESSPAEEWE